MSLLHYILCVAMRQYSMQLAHCANASRIGVINYYILCNKLQKNHGNQCQPPWNKVTYTLFFLRSITITCAICIIIYYIIILLLGWSLFVRSKKSNHVVNWSAAVSHRLLPRSRSEGKMLLCANFCMLVARRTWNKGIFFPNTVRVGSVESLVELDFGGLDIILTIAKLLWKFESSKTLLFKSSMISKG